MTMRLRLVHLTATVLGMAALALSSFYLAFAQAPSGQPGVAGAVLQPNVCDVRSFGAKGDGEHLDTVAIQTAIHACAEQGGGTVRFGPGTYLSGSIQLESNIMLNLGQGSRLLGSNDVAQYASVGHTSENRSTALIWPFGAHPREAMATRRNTCQ